MKLTGGLFFAVGVCIGSVLTAFATKREVLESLSEKAEPISGGVVGGIVTTRKLKRIPVKEPAAVTFSQILGDGKRQASPTKTQIAQEFWRKAIAEPKGQHMPLHEICKLATEDGIRLSTFMKAKRSLGVKRKEGVWKKVEKEAN